MNLRIRRAEMQDCELYFNWANDPAVRQNSINQEPIPWEGHQNWFGRKINDDNTFLYLLFSSHKPIGQVRFDIEDKQVLINYSIERSSRGKGFGKWILKTAIDKLHDDFGEKRITFKALVKIDNIPSQKIFERLGFEAAPSEEIKNIVYMVYNKNSKAL